MGGQQIPIQPYVYPPYPYYAAVPGYTPPGAPTQNNYMMTGSRNPYQYTDVSTQGDAVPDTRRNHGGVTEPFP